MSSENATLVESGIQLSILTWFLLVLKGKIILRKKSDFLEKNR
jgi:hypothetical protein